MSWYCGTQAAKANNSSINISELLVHVMRSPPLQLPIGVPESDARTHAEH